MFARFVARSIAMPFTTVSSPSASRAEDAARLRSYTWVSREVARYVVRKMRCCQRLHTRRAVCRPIRTGCMSSYACTVERRPPAPREVACAYAQNRYAGGWW